MACMSEQTETITFRIPSSLKTLLEQYAQQNGPSLTTVVREAIQMHIAPTNRRLYVPPAFLPHFDAFVDALSNSRSHVTILVVNDRSGDRVFFEGPIDGNFTNGSIVAIGRRNGQGPWILPRKDVVGWFQGLPSEANSLANALTRQGWRAAEPPY
jgi:hypothetical protein